MEGYVKIHRQMLSNPIVCKDTDHIAVWIYLLLNATHAEQDVFFNGRRVRLRPGQLITGRKSISSELMITESKVQRILKRFEIEQQIEQQTCTKNRLISLLNWDKYQSSEQRNEQQVNNERTTSEQQVNTNKNERMKECKKENKKLLCSPEVEREIVETNNVDTRDEDFAKIYAIYPKQRGKAKAFEYYCGWLKGRSINGRTVRLTNRQMYIAVRAYVNERTANETDLEFYKNFDTFMRKPILDYVPEDET